MCRAPPGRMLSIVSTSTVQIVIEAHVGEDEIGGQIRSDAGPPALFSGWLGLISALDRLLTDGTGADAAEDLSEGRKHPRHGAVSDMRAAISEHGAGGFHAEH